AGSRRDRTRVAAVRGKRSEADRRATWVPKHRAPTAVPQVASLPARPRARQQRSSPGSPIETRAIHKLNEALAAPTQDRAAAACAHAFWRPRKRRSNKLHGDAAERAEIGVQRVALLGVHHAGERAGEHEMAGLEADAVLAELVGEPGHAQRRVAEHA